jgi:hypothetical protein
MNWLGDVLDRLLAEVVERQWKLVLDIFVDRARDADTARFGEAL